MGRRTILYAVFCAVTLLASYHFVWMKLSLDQENERATLSSLMNGTADVPFQYRVLVPWIAKSLLNVHLPGLSAQHQVIKLLDMTSVFVLILVFRYYISLFIKGTALSMLLSYSMFYALVFNFILSRYAWYPWDMPSIPLFTAGLILLYRRIWLAYYGIFVLAILNKETSGLLTCVYFFTAIGRTRARTIVFHCALQLAIWLTIKLGLMMLYSHNGGAALAENHLRDNLAWLLWLKGYPHQLSALGYLWIPTLMGYRLIRDDFVRRSLLAAIPLFIAMAYATNLSELRIYTELCPLILMGFLLVVRELFVAELSAPGTSQNPRMS